jgi:RsiW-degrading membrane proteinase PrsW (M82 family)
MPAVAMSMAAALLPVVVFLAVLFLMDSFKLVPFRALGLAILAGAASAVAALALERSLQAAGLFPPRVFDWALPRYLAPLIEEPLKAVYVVVLLKRRRLAFLVDAALVGFAVGTGFALVENMYYLRALPRGGFALWLVRGFGPAIMHGAMTSLFAMLARGLTERHPERGAMALLPALAVPVVLHSAFNHFPMPPVVQTCVLLVVLPAVVTFAFERSERATREWVGEGMDLDVELLNLVTSPSFGQTRLGQYLVELRARFPGPVVGDMFCLLRVELELAIRAKGMLMAREAGLEAPAGPELTAKLEELRYLHHSIGPTGLLALAPLRVASERDDWHTYLLEAAGEAHGPLARGWRALRRRLSRRR